MLKKLENTKILIIPEDVHQSFVMTITLEGTTIEYVDGDCTDAHVILSGPLFALVSVLNNNTETENMMFIRNVNISGNKSIIEDLNIALNREHKIV
jgi:hypothetical protein